MKRLITLGCAAAIAGLALVTSPAYAITHPAPGKAARLDPFTHQWSTDYKIKKVGDTATSFWTIPFNGASSPYCLQDPSGGGLGTKVNLWDCDDGINSNEDWYYWAAENGPTGKLGGLEWLVNLWNGSCLNDPYADNGYRLTITKCSGDDVGQAWQVGPEGNDGANCYLPADWYLPYGNDNPAVAMPFVAEDGAWVISQTINLSEDQLWDGPYGIWCTP